MGKSKPKPAMPSQPMVHGKVVTQDTLPVKMHPMPKGGKPPRVKGRMK